MRKHRAGVSPHILAKLERDLARPVTPAYRTEMVQAVLACGLAPEDPARAAAIADVFLRP